MATCRYGVVAPHAIIPGPETYSIKNQSKNYKNMIKPESRRSSASFPRKSTFISIAVVILSVLVIALSSTSAAVGQRRPVYKQKRVTFTNLSPLTGGNVLKLDGATGFVRVGSNPGLNLQGPFSVEFWGYMDNWSAGSVRRTGLVSKIEHGSGGYEIGLDLDSTSKIVGVLLARCGTQSLGVSRPRTSLSSGWHLFTTTFDGRILRLYTDGVLSASADAGATCSIDYPYSFDVRFGRSARDDAYGVNYFNGRLDEVRFYNKILSLNEINTHYNGGAGQTGDPQEPNLVAGFHLDESAGMTADDYSPRNLTGSLFTGATWLPRVIAPDEVAGIQVSSITETGATVNWITGQLSNSVIDYGPTAAYGSLRTITESVSNHTIALTNLTPYTTYHYRVRSTNSSGQTASSGDQTFNTLDRAPTDKQFYVSPNGAAAANGAFGSPWDLKTALNHPSAIQPGSTIWLRGGRYVLPLPEGGYASDLNGTANAPIVVRSYPGEWAVIDGNLTGEPIKNRTILVINGSYTWFMDFEITNTEISNRKIDVTSSNPSERRGNAIDDYSLGGKLINLVIHDAGQGISAWSQAQDNEYYGNIVYNNGWDAPDRLHGHGVYTQNNSGYKHFRENYFFNGFGYNTQTGGTDIASVRNYTWDGNLFFNGSNGWQGPNIENLVVSNNYTYRSGFEIGHEVNPSYMNAQISGNYFMGGVHLFEFANGLSFQNNTVWSLDPAGRNVVISTRSNPTANFTLNNNTYYQAFRLFPYWHFRVNYYGTAPLPSNLHGDFAFNRTTGTQAQTYAYTGKSWQHDLGFDTNSTYIDGVPASTKVVVRPNKYDPKNRTNIIIYNWEGLSTVHVDLSSFLKPGDQYELHNVQDYFGDVISGTFGSGFQASKTISIPMTGRSRALPTGYSQVSSWYHDPLQANTFPQFGAFVLIRK